ncbi:hypothetical protein [Spiroplasma sp. AdecLV25b]|uniref:hypothetical protein n=1 Tax=Spiroplasma sp. AdecLV25b TaxID=3027162 RepID=UPI0027E0A1AC|nr:hypothetical protein [Spiroplasma sp. AdecLV25b]
MKKEALLLFKNAFKQAFRNKIQLVGLVILVLLSSTIFSLMQTSLSRISNEYSLLISNDPQHGSNSENGFHGISLLPSLIIFEIIF